MSASPASPASPAAASPRPVVSRVRGRFSGGGRALRAYTWVVLGWLFLPVLVMILFGFNDTPGRYNQTWEGFTLRWWGQVFALDELTRALIVSLTIAVVTMLVVSRSPRQVAQRPAKAITEPSAGVR